MKVKRYALLNSVCNFCLALDIDVEKVKKSEGPGKVAYRDPNLESTSIKKLKQSHLGAIFKAWGDKFKCKIIFFAGTFIFEHDNYENEMKKLSDATKFLSPDDTVDLEFTINKEGFCKDAFGTIPNTHFQLYLFQYRVVRILGGTFKDIEKDFFKDHQLKTIVLILDTNVYISGHHLAFIGGKYIKSHWNNVLPESPPRLKRLQNIWNIRDEETRWIQISTNLTPLHFLFTERLGRSDSIGEKTDIVLTNLIMTYLADRTRCADGITVTFEGTDKTSIKLAEERIDDPKHLIRLFLWSYGDKASDKLSIVRSIISLSLRQDPVRNYELLVQKAKHIYRVVRSNYKIYISRTIEKYFAARKEVSDYVSSLSQQLSRQVSEIISSLVTNMLAAIAAIVGAFLSYAISPEFSPLIFYYGLKAYAIYVLLFPCGYAMLHTYLEHGNMMHDFQYRKVLFSEFMSKDDIENTIGDTISKREKQFKMWFSLTTVIYLLVASCAWIVSSIDVTQWLNVP